MADTLVYITHLLCKKCTYLHIYVCSIRVDGTEVLCIKL